MAANVGALFPGMQVIQSHPFRVTRDAEVSIQELEAEDLLETIERGVRQRRFGRVVRLTMDTAMPGGDPRSPGGEPRGRARAMCTPWSRRSGMSDLDAAVLRLDGTT